MNWRKRVTGELLPSARTAVLQHDNNVIEVKFDWSNGVFLVVVPDDWDGDEDEIAAVVRRTVGVDARVDGPPEFPFSLHLRRLPGLVEHTPTAMGQPERLELSELIGLRAGLHKLQGLAEEFPRCCTFALGGLPIVGYIARLPQRFDTSSDEGLEGYLAALRASRAKYHVHEGLLWEVATPTPEERFHEWMASIPADEPLLVVDTTFSGGGVNRIMNSVLSAPSCPRKVAVHGLLDLSRTSDVPPDRVENRADRTVTATLHGVPRLITEDASEMVGYDSIRHVGGLRSRWDAATIEVCDNGETLTVIGTSHVAQTVSELIDSFTATDAMDANFKAASVYMAVLTQLDNELRRTLHELDRALSSKLLNEEEFEADRAAANKRFEGLRNTARRRLKQSGPPS